MNDCPRAVLTPVSFWYLRHGETDWNARGWSQGNTDIPLNPTGIAQARAAAASLRNRGIASIVASPLSRARVTAEIVAEALDLPVTLDDGLREVRFGVQEGRPMADWFADWIAGRMTPEGAESFPQLRARAAAAANRALTRPPVVLLVAHGALFRALRSAMGVEPNRRTRNAVPIWCEAPSGGTGWSTRYLTE
jgi:broad specificity phosphatase PhoE